MKLCKISEPLKGKQLIFNNYEKMQKWIDAIQNNDKINKIKPLHIYHTLKCNKLEAILSCKEKEITQVKNLKNGK